MMSGLLIMQYVLYGLELSACIVGFINWKKIKSSFWKWFPFYLAFIVLVELTANYLNSFQNYGFKRVLLNYFAVPAEFMFLYFLYYKFAESDVARRRVIISAVVYFASFVFEHLFLQGKKPVIDSFSYSIGSLALLVLILSFFYQFAVSEGIVHFRSSLMFWISLGLLVFYLGTLPYFGLLSLLYREYRPIYTFYSYFMLLCNWVMYSLFIVGFIWGKPK